MKKLSDDEFGDVAYAFNQMAHVLKETVISRNFYEQAKIDAEKATRLKSEFLSTISHEIRTPLNGIIGFSEELREEETSEERRAHLAMITSCGHNLLALINDILDLSKIEAGKIAITPAPVELEHVVTEIAQLFEATFKRKGLAFSWTLQPDAPATLTTDAVRLRQILVNLVDNAIKYTAQGEIALTIGAYHGPRTGSVVFAVRDTGKGIPADKHDMIFESFTRIEPQGIGGEDGTGLGLAIAANLVKLLGGEIWLESTPEKGSTFSFTIA